MRIHVSSHKKLITLPKNQSILKFLGYENMKLFFGFFVHRGVKGGRDADHEGGINTFQCRLEGGSNNGTERENVGKKFVKK